MEHRGIHYFSPTRADRDWGLYATGTGHGVYAPGESYPASVHARAYLRPSWGEGRVIDEFQLVYIHGGGGVLSYRLNGQVFTVGVGQGDLFVLQPGVWHTYAPSAETGWEEYWIGFKGGWARHLQRSGIIPPDRMVYRHRDRSWLHAFYEALISYPGQHTDGVQTHLRHRIMELLERLRREPEQLGDIPHRALLEAVRKEMSLHFRLHRPVESFLRDASRRVGDEISYSHFRSLFRQCYRISPGQYLDQLRLAEAKKRLHLGKMQVKEISSELGFESPYYFSRFFKKHQGVSPAFFR